MKHTIKKKKPNTVIDSTKKTAQWAVLVSREVQFIMLPQAAKIRNINQNYTKEVAKRVLKNAIVTAKNDSTYSCKNKIPGY